MTATKRFTVDSNILIYSVDKSEGHKNTVASEILDSLAAGKGPLPLQCLSEFFRATTKKKILTPAAGMAAVQEFLPVFSVVPSTTADLQLALQITLQHRLQFFDAMLIATASNSGCTTFFSEDMHDGHSFGPLTVRNPFAMPEAELRALLA